MTIMPSTKNKMPCSLLTLFLLLCGVYEVFCCPKDCSCKWKDGRLTMECINLDLTTIPENGYEDRTQVANFSENNFPKLHNNMFNKQILETIQKLYLRKCGTAHIETAAFNSLINLIELDLSNNELTNVPTEALSYLKYLKILSLSNNAIESIGPYAFQNLNSLNSLDLSKCLISNIQPNAFANLNNLEKILLNNNRLMRLSIGEMIPLSTMPKLKTLQLHGNPWVCDCETRGLVQWVRSNNMYNPEPLYCTGGPERLKDKSFSSLDLDDFACTPVIVSLLPVEYSSDSSSDLRELSVPAGEKVTLLCRVKSEPPATITWYFDKLQLSNNTVAEIHDARLYIETFYVNITSPDEQNEQASRTVMETRSKLVMSNLEDPADFGPYLCVADNRAGNAERTFTLNVAARGHDNAHSLISSFLNKYTMGGALLILILLFIVVFVVKKMVYTSDDEDDDDDPKMLKKRQAEAAAAAAAASNGASGTDTSSQRSSQDSSAEMKSDCGGKAFTVISDLSYSRSFSDIAGAPHHPQGPPYSNPDLINGTAGGAGMRHSSCTTPQPISRPISDYCYNSNNATMNHHPMAGNWNPANMPPPTYLPTPPNRTASSMHPGASYNQQQQQQQLHNYGVSMAASGTPDHMMMMMGGHHHQQHQQQHPHHHHMGADTASAAGSGSDEVFTTYSRMSDYPADYGLPILTPAEDGTMPADHQQPSAKTLKVWQRGVPVLPTLASNGGTFPPALSQQHHHLHHNMTTPTQLQQQQQDRAYQRCGTDV